MVDFDSVDSIVEGEGVDTTVVRVPDISVTMVDGSKVWTIVLTVPPIVESKVIVIGLLVVGVVTTTSVTLVPPTSFVMV